MPYFTTPPDDPTEEVDLSVFKAREKRTSRSEWIFEGSQATPAGSKRDICSDTAVLTEYSIWVELTAPKSFEEMLEQIVRPGFLPPGRRRALFVTLRRILCASSRFAQG